MSCTYDQYSQQRWVPCRNVGLGAVVPFGVVEYTGVDVDAEGTEVVRVQAPSVAGVGNTCFNGPKGMGAGDYGSVTFETPCIGAYDPPSVGPFHGQIFGPAVTSRYNSNVTGNGFGVIGDIDSINRLALFDYGASGLPSLTVSLTGTTDGTGAYQSMTVDSQGYTVGVGNGGVLSVGGAGINVLKIGVYRISLSSSFTIKDKADDIPPTPWGVGGAGWFIKYWGVTCGQKSGGTNPVETLKWSKLTRLTHHLVDEFEVAYVSGTLSSTELRAFSATGAINPTIASDEDATFDVTATLTVWGH